MVYLFKGLMPTQNNGSRTKSHWTKTHRTISKRTKSKVLSPWDIVRLDIVLHGFLSPLDFVPLGFCHFVSLGYCPPGLLSPYGIVLQWDFVLIPRIIWYSIIYSMQREV